MTKADKTNNPWYASTERQLSRAATAMQVGVNDLLDCDVSDHQSISREITSLEHIHKLMGECIKRIKKENK